MEIPSDTVTQELEENSVEEEIPKRAFDSSYYGWARGMSKSPMDITPQRLDKEIEVGHQGSAWNAGGTWEEKDKSTWARTRLQELIGEIKVADEELRLRAEIVQVDKCEGKATVVYSRGRKRVGFEFDVEASWRIMTEEEEEQQCTSKLIEFEDTNSEDYEIYFDLGGNSEVIMKAKRILPICEQLLRKVLKRWKVELSEQE